MNLGDDSYAICNVGGELSALYGYCPHAGGPLGHGALHGNMLVCPYHAWEFDCRTGRFDRNHDVCVDRFAVKTDGVDIFLDIP